MCEERESLSSARIAFIAASPSKKKLL